MSLNPMDLFNNYQNVRAKVEEMQEKLKNLSVTGSSGGGMVQMEIDGNFSVRKVLISKEVVDPEDVAMLQDLVLAASTDALHKMKEKMKEETLSITGDLNLPPGFLGL